MNAWTIAVAVSCLAVLVAAAPRLVTALHMLQLDSYSNKRLMKWLVGAPGRIVDVTSVAGLLLLVAGCFVLQRLEVHSGPFWVLGGLGLLGVLLLASGLRPKREIKKPLKFTGRATRILGTAALLLIAMGAGAVWLSTTVLVASYSSAGIIVAAALLVIAGAPAAIMLANFALIPVQSGINATYVRRAMRRLSHVNPTVVGITGSYGKTSTKYFTEVLLGSRRRVLKTPESYNTLLGICRVINDELEERHEVFVAEMGAYRPGDIGEIARLVHPKIGVITAIGPQHLERFGSVDRIERTKYELIDSLSQDGVAIFNADDERCRAMADRTRHVRVLRYAIDHANRDVGARDIHHGPDGLSFVIEDRSGDSATVRTRVLGRHNVLNILGASCVAMEFGIKCQDIARFAGRLRPAPHRLELIHGSGGLVILDDSYNSNPIGAKGALEVLGEFKDGNRILVTPGMVELGTEEERLNQEFGEMAAGVCSRVILVGKARTTPILNGLRRQGFSEADTSVVESLGEARAELARVGQPGDVVLLENDLPDLYNE